MQQQRIYARHYGHDHSQAHDLRLQHRQEQGGSDDEEEDDEEEWVNGRKLAYGEDNQPPFLGSPVAVLPRGYMPQGVWRPEDHEMFDPEQE
jgi:hypothetical protein